jgi:hypothetical protein
MLLSRQKKELVMSCGFEKKKKKKAKAKAS